MGNSTANETGPREKGPTLLERHQLWANPLALGQLRRVDLWAAVGQRPHAAGPPDAGADADGPGRRQP